MKKTLMLLAVLALVLFSSTSYAGYVFGASANDSNPSFELANNAQAIRSGNVTATAGSESETVPFSLDPGDSVEATYEDPEPAPDCTLVFQINGADGSPLTQATISYTNGTFSPVQIGDGLNYTSSAPNSFTLTITK